MQFSIFDLDRTLTRRGTYFAFLLFAVWKLRPLRLVFLPPIVILMGAHKLNLVSRRRLKEIMQHLMLGYRIDRSRIAAIVEDFADHQLKRNIYPEAIALLASEKAAGRRIVIATAAHRFYASAIAARLGADDLIATESLVRDEYLLAGIAGDNCYADAKRDRIALWLRQAGCTRADAHIRFFSDDASDRPTFEWCDEPVAVNPHGRLFSLATRNAWRVFDWRLTGSPSRKAVQPA